MPEVIWRPEAQAALYDLVAYISEHDPAAARRILRRILESMEPARVYPNFGRIGRVSGTREAIAHPNYIVIYRVQPNAVEVIDVVHARQQYPWHPCVLSAFPHRLTHTSIRLVRLSALP